MNLCDNPINIYLLYLLILKNNMDGNLFQEDQRVRREQMDPKLMDELLKVCLLVLVYVFYFIWYFYIFG